MSGQTLDISFNGTILKGALNGDSSYVFMIPVVAAGPVALTIPGFSSTNSLQLTIQKYTPITNPQSVIDNYITDRDKLIDTVLKAKPGGYQTPAATISLIKELKESWKVQMEKTSPEDKLLLAYFLDKNKVSSPPVASSIMSDKSARIVSDAGDLLFEKAKTYVKYNIFTIASGAIMIGAGTLFLVFPNPISGAAFIAAEIAFVVNLELSKSQASEVGTFPGIVESIWDLR